MSYPKSEILFQIHYYMYVLHPHSTKEDNSEKDNTQKDIHQKNSNQERQYSEEKYSETVFLNF